MKIYGYTIKSSNGNYDESEDFGAIIYKNDVCLAQITRNFDGNTSYITSKQEDIKELIKLGSDLRDEHPEGIDGSFRYVGLGATSSIEAEEIFRGDEGALKFLGNQIECLLTLQEIFEEEKGAVVIFVRKTASPRTDTMSYAHLRPDNYSKQLKKIVANGGLITKIIETEEDLDVI